MTGYIARWTATRSLTAHGQLTTLNMIETSALLLPAA